MLRSSIVPVLTRTFFVTRSACVILIVSFDYKGRSLATVLSRSCESEQRGGHTERRQPLETGLPRSYCFSSMNTDVSPLSSPVVRYFYRLTPTRRHLLLPLDYSTPSVFRSSRLQTMINTIEKLSDASRQFSVR